MNTSLTSLRVLDRFFCIVALLLVLGHSTRGAGESMTERVAAVLRDFRTGSRKGFPLDLYNEAPLQAASLFLTDIESFAQVDQRRQLVDQSARLARRSARKQPKHPRRVRDSDLCDRWISVCENDPSGEIRERTAKYLREIIDLRMLDSQATRIRDLAMKRPGKEQVMLYAILPSTDLAGMRMIVAEMKIQPSAIPAQRFFVDSLLARHEDQRAQKEILSAVRSATLPDMMPSAISEYLSLIATQELKKGLAQLLRTEEILDRGGRRWPVRTIYADALYQMIREREDCPFEIPPYWYDDKSLDTLEKWCAEHLGTKYPSVPRKQMGPPMLR